MENRIFNPFKRRLFSSPTWPTCGGWRHGRQHLEQRLGDDEPAADRDTAEAHTDQARALPIWTGNLRRQGSFGAVML